MKKDGRDIALQALQQTWWIQEDMSTGVTASDNKLYHGHTTWHPKATVGGAQRLATIGSVPTIMVAVRQVLPPCLGCKPVWPRMTVPLLHL